MSSVLVLKTEPPNISVDGVLGYMNTRYPEDTELLPGPIDFSRHIGGNNDIESLVDDPIFKVFVMTLSSR